MLTRRFLLQFTAAAKMVLFFYTFRAAMAAHEGFHVTQRYLHSWCIWRFTYRL